MDAKQMFEEAGRLRDEAERLEREATALLRSYRQDAGVSQTHVAGAMRLDTGRRGASQAYVSKIENSDRVSPDVASAYFAAIHTTTKGATDDRNSKGAGADLAKARRTTARP